MADTCLIPHIRNVRQLRNMCGPAALATVLNYWGIDISQEEIAMEAFDPSVQATHGTDLLRFSLNSGLCAFSYRGSLEDIRRSIAAGRPLITRSLCHNGSTSAHYRVIIGYASHPSRLILLDPSRPGVWTISYRRFVNLWRPCAKWTLTVSPFRMCVH